MTNLCLCILAVGIQHAMRMRHITLSSVACLALLYLSTLSHKRHDFRLRHCAISRKVVGSIPDGVIGIFH
jgi:hypothetical protein